NAGTSPVVITELKTSCECLTLTLPKKVVAPGETVSATAKVDFADDPKYVGRLELEGTGKASSPGPDAFVIHVRVEVREGAPAGPPCPVRSADRLPGGERALAEQPQRDELGAQGRPRDAQGPGRLRLVAARVPQDVGEQLALDPRQQLGIQVGRAG